jgi:hypothetical protein
MSNPKENIKVMQAIANYLDINDLVLPDNARYAYVIDAVDLYIDDVLVLWVGLPPVSNYPVRETEHTHKYLKKKALSAS